MSKNFNVSLPEWSKEDLLSLEQEILWLRGETKFLYKLLEDEWNVALELEEENAKVLNPENDGVLNAMFSQKALGRHEVFKENLGVLEGFLRLINQTLKHKDENYTTHVDE